jgi:uncharacterized protein (TIGR02266 family)
MQDEAALLSALESEALLAEAQLEQDLIMARKIVEQTEQRLRALRAAAEQIAPEGKEAAMIYYQLGKLAPPRFDAEDTRWAALQVRRKALAQRKAAHASFQEALESFGRRTAELELQLNHQQQWLARAQAHVMPKPVPVSDVAVAAQTSVIAPVAAVHPPRRQSPRVALCAEIDMSSDSNFYAGFTTDLSDGGLFIATVKAPPKGTQVELSFTLPGGERLTAQGVVRWTREVNDALPEMMPGAGVQFVDLPPEVARSITEFVMLRDPLFYVD